MKTSFGQALLTYILGSILSHFNPRGIHKLYWQRRHKTESVDTQSPQEHNRKKKEEIVRVVEDEVKRSMEEEKEKTNIAKPHNNKRKQVEDQGKGAKNNSKTDP